MHLCLISRKFQNYLKDNVGGATPTLSQSFLGSCLIPITDKNRQDLIVNKKIYGIFTDSQKNIVGIKRN